LFPFPANNAEICCHGKLDGDAANHLRVNIRGQAPFPVPYFIFSLVAGKELGKLLFPQMIPWIIKPLQWV